MRRLLRFEVFLVVVYMGIQLYAASSDAYNLPNAWFIRDDAYYYFKVAQNISEGRGSTFDGLHPTNGYHPLWLLVCVPIFALARWDVILPLRVLLIVMSALNVATGLLIYRLLRQSLSQVAGVLAAIYWVFDPYIQGTYYITGLESGLAIFFMALLLFETRRFETQWHHAIPSVRRLAWLGLVAALTMFSRLDLVFLAFIAGLWLVFRQTPLRYLLPLDMVTLAAATLLGFVLRLGFPNYYSASRAALTTVALGLPIKILILFFFGLYTRPGDGHPKELVRKAVLASALSSLLLLALLAAGKALRLLPDFSLVILLLETIFSLSGVLLNRLLVFGLQSPGREAAPSSPLDSLKAHWRLWLRDGAAYYGVLGGLLAAYMLWNRLTFGTFTPVSGQIKQWWGTFLINIYGGPARTPLAFFMLDPNSEFNAWEPAISTLQNWQRQLIEAQFPWSHSIPPEWRFLMFTVLLGLVVYAFLRLRSKKVLRAISQSGMLLLFAGSWLQIFFYNTLGYASFKGWYWLSEPLLGVFSAALVVDVAFSVFLKKWALTRAVMWVLVTLFSVRAAYGYGNTVRLQMPHGAWPADTPYISVLPTLESLTEPGAVIGMTGGGNFGYFIHDRTVVNMDGLINSYEYFQALKNGQGADYLYNNGMRYVFANPYLLEAIPYRGQYSRRLELLAELGGKDLMRLLPARAP